MAAWRTTRAEGGRRGDEGDLPQRVVNGAAPDCNLSPQAVDKRTTQAVDKG